MNLFDIDLYDESNPDGQMIHPGQQRTSDPYDETDECPNGHDWEAGMCCVNPEDLAAGYFDAKGSRKVECAKCETVYEPMDDN